MSQEFIQQWYPRIIHVQRRDLEFWQTAQFEVHRPSVQIFNTGYVFSGEGSLEVNGVCASLTAETWFHFCPGDRIRLVSSKSSPLNFISVHFDYKLLYWEGTELQTRPSKDGIPFPNVLQEIGLHPEYSELLDLWENKPPGFEWQARHGLTRIVAAVFDEQRKQQHPRDPHRSAMHSVLEYIHSHYLDPPDRAEMAARASMSASYFSILFKQHTGYSYVNYIRKIRMDKAKLLLRDRQLSIAEVARSVGFDDPLYFSKLFSRETGMSPRDYRHA